VHVVPNEDKVQRWWCSTTTVVALVLETILVTLTLLIKVRILFFLGWGLAFFIGDASSVERFDLSSTPIPQQ
jgi:uncharacterized membrane protein